LRIRPWIWLAAGLIALYAIQQLPLGQKINLFISPLTDVIRTPSRWWREFDLWFADRQRLQAGNLRLREKLQRQAGVQQEINALRAENSELRKLLGLKDLPGYHWQAARVLGRSPDKMSQRLILRTHRAVSPNDVVASSAGLVGLVDAVQGEHAVVRTILDASLAVPATLPGSKLAAMVRGRGKNLRVELIPWKLVPPVGSILVTSGAGGVFPPGLPVARVTRVRKIPGSVFSDIGAVPEANWRRDAWLSIASLHQP